MGGDAEEGGGGAIAMALGEEFEEANFVRGELAIRALGRMELLEEFDDAAGDLRGHGRTAVEGLADAVEEAGGGRLLQQVAAGAGAKRIEDSIVVLVNGQDDDQDFGMDGLQ